MNVRIQIIQLLVFNFTEKRKMYGATFSRRKELHAWGGSAADNNDRTVGQYLIGGVPPALGELNVLKLLPVTNGRRVTRNKLTEFAKAVEVAAGLDEGTIGEELAGGAPGVGEDGEGAEGVSLKVEENRVSITVSFQNRVILVIATVVSGEAYPGRTDVGTVEEHDGVEAGDGGVHGSYAGIGDEEFPRPGQGGA